MRVIRGLDTGKIPPADVDLRSTDGPPGEPPPGWLPEAGPHDRLVDDPKLDGEPFPYQSLDFEALQGLPKEGEFTIDMIKDLLAHSDRHGRVIPEFDEKYAGSCIVAMDRMEAALHRITDVDDIEKVRNRSASRTSRLRLLNESYKVVGN